MAFTTDKQTLEDLNLLGKFRKNSVYSLFDRTRTRVGRQRLEAMFRQPLCDAEAINARSAGFRYFAGTGVVFPFDGEQIDEAGSYMDASAEGGGFAVACGILAAKARQLFASDRGYEKMQDGLRALLRTVAGTADLLRKVSDAHSPVRERCLRFFAVFDDAALDRIRRAAGQERFALAETIRWGRYFRSVCREAVGEMLQLLYDLDLWLSVASAARECGFGYAEALPAGERKLEIGGVRHPALAKAVANDVSIDADRNVFFLTGVNMAGKSTFMKSVATAVYLAHMGFPVAARSMRFSLLDGVYTSINVPDDIEQGYSHFYAEVLRVKHIAEQVSAGRNLLVVFDELFKGTNVKDAYDATLAVTTAFSAYRNCKFIISTHIIEVGPALSERCGNVQFHYFPSELDGTRPVYRYLLAEGISNDRHGMTIINNERILETIRGEAAETEI